MKPFILATLVLTLTLLGGCASVPTEYHQGCRDGVRGVQALDDEATNTYCDELDAVRRHAELRAEQRR